MMEWIYTICAIAGGTLFLCQFVMLLLGLGGDHDVDTDHDIAVDHDASHDAGHDSGHGFGLHSLFSLKALVVGVALFGLTGRVAGGSHLSAAVVAGIAAGAGAVGLVGMGLLLHALRKLEAEGTVRIQQALGEEATVYLTIPARNAGPGKITVTIQNRLMELPAVTDSPDPIPTGAQVEVVDLLDGDTLKVAPLPKGGKALRAPSEGTAAPEQQAAPVQKPEGERHA